MIGKGNNALIWRVCESVFTIRSNRKSHGSGVSAERIKGECTIERVALVMNMVPCRGLNLGGQR